MDESFGRRERGGLKVLREGLDNNRRQDVFRVLDFLGEYIRGMCIS